MNSDFENFISNKLQIKFEKVKLDMKLSKDFGVCGM